MLRPFEPLAARVWPTEAQPPFALAEAQQTTAKGRMSTATVSTIHSAQRLTLVDRGSKPEFADIDMVAMLPLELPAESYSAAVPVVQRIPAPFAGRAAAPRAEKFVSLSSLVEPLQVECQLTL